ncbi:MAG: UDP-N-acetylmuramoyl-tripeptide--D-alanyl-D-alanine ligase [Planctomycetes bacterium]|jgi:UDP-N-acetylmuramoyl-tripeptide--D-alanyl-D-alanine ligase|nr:UDP-N-acetylmuramoyl-tripeptide--D-alanyl-D-alanine ligase [Planctomycetota bacterium]
MKNLPVSLLARIVGSEPVDDRQRDFAGVSTDTRTLQSGACFFAIAGATFDGHNYVPQAFAKGAACAVVERAVEGLAPAAGPILRVPNTIKALGDLAREYRRRSGFKVVAITGSVGKTTTRQIVHHVLGRDYRVHQAQKSFNNDIGLPLTLLDSEPQTEIVVAELGANHPGEIAYLTRIAQPDVALVTNAHPAHLEGFGDLATIVREKLSIAEGLREGGVLIVNGGIEPLVAACRSRGRPFRTFGTSHGTRYRADSIVCEARHSTFIIDGTPIRLPLPGPGNVENALAAWAVCDQFGVSLTAFATALESLAGVAMRAETLQVGGLTVLNDCYNANPASMRNALAMLHNLRPAGAGDRRRLVFICGAMAELGPQTEALHAELGTAVAEAGVDLLVTVGGPPQTTARAARKAARQALETRSFDDTRAVCDHLKEFLRKDDILLVKGSRTGRLEQVVQELTKDYG